MIVTDHSHHPLYTERVGSLGPSPPTNEINGLRVTRLFSEARLSKYSLRTLFLSCLIELSRCADSSNMTTETGRRSHLQRLDGEPISPLW